MVRAAGPDELAQARRVCVEAEEPRQCRSAEVGVDEDHAPAGLSERDGEIGGGRRLALALDGARDHHNTGLFPIDGELHARTKECKRLGIVELGTVAHHQLAFLLEILGRGGQATKERKVQLAGHFTR